MNSNGVKSNKRNLIDIIYIVAFLIAIIALILSLTRVLPWYFLLISIILNLIIGLSKCVNIIKNRNLKK